MHMMKLGAKKTEKLLLQKKKNEIHALLGYNTCIL